MDYPLIEKNEDHYPKEPLCPVCKIEKVFEPHTFICLSGGALVYNKKGNSKFVENHNGFLSISYHGHHYENIEDSKKDVYASIPIVDDSLNGQFDIYFCSKECVKKWVGELLNDLEEKAFEN